MQLESHLVLIVKTWGCEVKSLATCFGPLDHNQENVLGQNFHAAFLKLKHNVDVIHRVVQLTNCRCSIHIPIYVFPVGISSYGYLCLSLWRFYARCCYVLTFVPLQQDLRFNNWNKVWIKFALRTPITAGQKKATQLDAEILGFLG
jgi:hypothetical protein